MTPATVVRGFTRNLCADDTSENETPTWIEPLQAQSARRQPLLRIMPDPSDEETLGTSWGKFFFQVPAQLLGIGARAFIVELRADPSQIGYTDDAITASSPCAPLSRRLEPDPDVWRGVFAFEHKHRELFSEVVELDIRTLPRWKPRITLTRRMLETDDE